MSEPVLRLQGVERVYRKGTPGEVRVLRGADLELRAGELVALVAPSGAGKSTLLQIAGLLDRLDGGRVEIAGRDVSRAGDAERTRVRREMLGFVYQFHHLLPDFSAEENVAMPCRAAGQGAGAALARARELLGAVGLAARATHRPAELSGGEQQRVAVARALANRPRLLLADEPTGNLDPATAGEVFGLLAGLAREAGLAALIATHNPELAARMDRIVRIEAGLVVPG